MRCGLRIKLSRRPEQYKLLSADFSYPAELLRATLTLRVQAGSRAVCMFYAGFGLLFFALPNVLGQLCGEFATLRCHHLLNPCLAIAEAHIKVEGGGAGGLCRPG